MLVNRGNSRKWSVSQKVILKPTQIFDTHFDLTEIKQFSMIIRIDFTCCKIRVSHYLWDGTDRQIEPPYLFQ